jgi:hypothetical protein
MRKCFKALTVVSLLVTSSLALAGWTVGGGYTNYSDDDGDGSSISLGAVYGSAGYQYQSGSITYMPELRLGTGVKDDTLYGVGIEIDSFIAASFRAQFDASDKFSIFIQPSYARLEITGSYQGESVSSSDWEFGVGGGASYRLNERASIEAVYEVFDGTDVISVGFRTSF